MNASGILSGVAGDEPAHLEWTDRTVQPFAFLTRQGQARRMRALAFTAVEKYDLDVERLRLVNNDTNCTFRVDTADGRSFALRISLPDVHSPAEIEEEVAWQLAVARETDISVPEPVPNRSGDYVVTAGADGVPEERHCVIFSWLGGRMMEDVASSESFRRFGALAAKLHRHGAYYRPRQPGVIRRSDRLYPFNDPEKLFDESTARLFPEDAYATLLEMREAAKCELDWLFGRGALPQIIHGDLHWWNVMSNRGRLQVIDFEDLTWGFPVQDIAITFYYSARSEDFPALRDAFREGYESVAPWPELYPGQIELHMVHRAVDLFNFVLGSTLRRDREILDGFVEGFQTHHREMFETWRGQFSEDFLRR